MLRSDIKEIIKTNSAIINRRTEKLTVGEETEIDRILPPEGLSISKEDLGKLRKQKIRAFLIPIVRSLSHDMFPGKVELWRIRDAAEQHYAIAAEKEVDRLQSLIESDASVRRKIKKLTDPHKWAQSNSVF
jgi:hypothetical protein